MEKNCTKCGVSKSLEKFGKHKKGIHGKNAECKQCQAKREKKYKDARKEHTKEYNLQYKTENREYTLKYATEYAKMKYNTDPIYRFKSNMRTHINVRLKNFLKKKKGKTLDYIGCDWQTFINHLESQFKSEMSWDNYGRYWELDHIKPLSKGGTFHFKNTQPLTVAENRYKSNKY